MKYLSKLPDADELKEKYSLTYQQEVNRDAYIKNICEILEGKNNRKLLIIGPCSADNEEAVLEYTCKLARLSEKVSDRFFIIPRIYTSKPRTSGMGYKGLLHNPNAEIENGDILKGIVATRKIHLHIIQQTGMYGADEMLYSESMYYTSDLLGYITIGARSVEDQLHRMTASGMNLPVGMKNPTSGSMDVLLNAIAAAQHEQQIMYHGWEVMTEGNPYAHAILRGYTDIYGLSKPNYHYEDICKLYDNYLRFNLKNIGVIIDCNHANSNKCYKEQPRIAKEIKGLCVDNTILDKFIKGFMIESYLASGNQLVGGKEYGKSITDACLSWNETEKLVLELAEK